MDKCGPGEKGFPTFAGGIEVGGTKSKREENTVF